MSGWNYRTHRRILPNGGEAWTMRSTYYNDEGVVTFFSGGDEGNAPTGATQIELRDDLLLMLQGWQNSEKGGVILSDDMEFASDPSFVESVSKAIQEADRLPPIPHGQVKEWLDELAKNSVSDFEKEYNAMDSQLRILEAAILQMKARLDPDGEDPMLASLLANMQELKSACAKLSP